MNETGQEAPDPFLAGSDGVPPGSLLGRVRNQDAATWRRHWRGRTRVLVAASAVAAVAAGVTPALLMVSDSNAPSARAAVTGALAESSAESYSFSLDSTTQFARRQLQSSVVSGTFDPEHELGTELLLSTRMRLRSVRAQIRFIGKYVYMRVYPGPGFATIPKAWNKAPVPPAGGDAVSWDSLYGFVTDRPVSPAELSGVLRSAGTVRDGGSASGLGWTGTKYAFAARFSGGRESVSGTVYVDTQGRVRRLVTVTMQEGVTTDRDLTFGNFGAPVQVTAPTVSQVQYTSQPYWGFFF